MTDNLEPEFTDLAWEDEVYDEEEYPYVLEDDDYDDYDDYDDFHLGSWVGDGDEGESYLQEDVL